MKKLNTEQFIEKAKCVHGDRYDYSLSRYEKAHSKIDIVCSLHGLFRQAPTSHLGGNGCPQCAEVARTSYKRKLNTKKFIERSVAVHGDKFNYSLTKYVDCHTRLTIVCSAHGEFNQRPHDHLKGYGCPLCKGEKISNSKKKITTGIFVERSNAIHSSFYDYSMSEYLGHDVKVTIGCPIHGRFSQYPHPHMGGRGCQLCANQKIAESKTISTEEYVCRSTAVHGNLYDYSSTIYSGCKDSVNVKCLSHGEFVVNASNHLQGQGCPCCAESGFKSDKPALLYLLRFDKPIATFWKIGITNRTINKRFPGEHRHIGCANTWRFQVGADAKQIEQSLLTRFRKYRFSENFLFNLLQGSGDTECFVSSLPTSRVVSCIKKLAKGKSLIDTSLQQS